MVETQIVARGIRDARVLSAMRTVPRERFLPPDRHSLAYADRAVEAAGAQTISQPYMVARMTECLALAGTERVLEVGTGTGYQATILSLLAREVFTIERIPDLSEAARTRLAALGRANAHFFTGDGSVGLPPHAPFDRILVTAGAPRVPGAILSQLADGGRLVIPVGPREEQDLEVHAREGAAIRVTRMGPCRFVPLVGEQGWRGTET
ncbi:MAG: protein-L-isoaspartate(D-aspartate) O-methyltransferase [Planctomycetes bacterium]|nr:protein-L-isoaspartate(D-aspartate) O-methyltransferase [Planctomycetota bacterium]